MRDANADPADRWPESPWDFDGPLGPHDLVAVGADLEPATLLAAYRAGLFPMPGDGTIQWFSPLERGVLRSGDLRVSRSLHRATKRFIVTMNTAFVDVMVACADPSRPHGWINPEFVRAYSCLHDLGHAHSVEVRRPDDGALVGGLYGVAMGSLFAGESMFHRENDASKVALKALVEFLDETDSDWLIDTQWPTDHLVSLGVSSLPRDAYREAVRAHVATPERTWPPKSRFFAEIQ